MNETWNEQLSVIRGDICGAVAIMQETAQRLVDAGIPLWNMENLTAEKLSRGLEPSDFFVFKVGGEPAAAMILQWEDKLFWPELKKGESGFVHKLSVRGKFTGRGLSAQMMEYAKEECRRRGVRHLRLDTDAGRPKLCGLYEGMGFKCVGYVQLEKRVALYEMEL